MMRQCTRCSHAFAPADLAREESRDMATDRKEAGLVGVRFFYYRCPACTTEDIFIDIIPLEGESPDDYATRHAAMQATARAMQAEKVDVVVVPVKPPPAAVLDSADPPG